MKYSSKLKKSKVKNELKLPNQVNLYKYALKYAKAYDETNYNEINLKLFDKAFN